jgi:hypothetical protein
MKQGLDCEEDGSSSVDMETHEIVAEERLRAKEGRGEEQRGVSLESRVASKRVTPQCSPGLDATRIPSR